MALCFLIPEEALRRRIELHRARQCHTRNAFVSTASSTDLPLEYLICPPAYGGTLWSGPRLQFDNTSHLRGTMFHDSTHNLSSNFGKFCRVALRQQAGPAGFEQEYVDAVYAARFFWYLWIFPIITKEGSSKQYVSYHRTRHGRDLVVQIPLDKDRYEREDSLLELQSWSL